jgi:hypothetical protein
VTRIDLLEQYLSIFLWGMETLWAGTRSPPDILIYDNEYNTFPNNRQLSRRLLQGCRKARIFPSASLKIIQPIINQLGHDLQGIGQTRGAKPAAPLVK